jgi:DNA-binding CsgD family transcriptional regulator
MASRSGALNIAAYFPGILAVRTGELNRGLAQLQAAAEFDAPNPLAGARLAVAHAWLGEAQRANDKVSTARTLLVSDRDRAIGEINYAAALVVVLAGRARDAWPLLRDTADLLDKIAHREPSHPPVLPLAVEAACAAGDAVDALRLCERLERDTLAVDSAFGLAASRGARGRLAVMTGNDEAAAAYFLDEAESFEHLKVPLYAARAWVALADVLRRTNQRRRARQALETARDMYASCGAALLAAEAEARLSHISGRMAVDTRRLTPGEGAVAELVAEGLRNSEVAAHLHLSVKTVENHLSHIYAKLGVRNRAGLARVVAEKLRATEPGSADQPGARGD